MTTIEEHRRALDESIRAIKACVDFDVESSPRTIGFNCSAGSVDILSIYLHKLGKLPVGKIIDHTWFKPLQLGQKKLPIYQEKLNFDFPKNEEIFELMCRIEEKRNKLIYGKGTKAEIEGVLESFWKLKGLVESELGGEL